jgi:hypothetical protein
MPARASPRTLYSIRPKNLFPSVATSAWSLPPRMPSSAHIYESAREVHSRHSVTADLETRTGAPRGRTRRDTSVFGPTLMRTYGRNFTECPGHRRPHSPVACAFALQGQVCPQEDDTEEFCQECERLLAEYVSAVRETRVMLGVASQARETGVLDELGSLVADIQLENSLSHLRQARQEYGRHQQERHG